MSTVPTMIKPSLSAIAVLVPRQNVPDLFIHLNVFWSRVKKCLLVLTSQMRCNLLMVVKPFLFFPEKVRQSLYLFASPILNDREADLGRISRGTLAPSHVMSSVRSVSFVNLAVIIALRIGLKK